MSVKEKIYSELEKASDFISGQDLADACGVTRASVWKAIKSLQEEGANIEAVTNKGYKLITDNIFNQASIEKYISSNSKIIFYETIDSTNTQAKRLLTETSAALLNKTVLIAAEQTAGRGRLGRSFYSPKQTGIYFSIIYSPENGINPATITAQTAVGVSRAIKNVFGVETQIKWVNDIYLNNHKICGILTEGTANFETGKIEAAIIGVGINISINDQMPEEIKNTAGAIYSQTENYKRSELAAESINQILSILDGTASDKKTAIEEYKERSLLIGKEITVTPVIDVSQGQYKCVVTGISDDAKLIVQLSDGTTRQLDSGEVTLHQN